MQVSQHLPSYGLTRICHYLKPVDLWSVFSTYILESYPNPEQQFLDRLKDKTTYISVLYVWEFKVLQNVIYLAPEHGGHWKTAAQLPFPSSV